jgi:hypothetical protein
MMRLFFLFISALSLSFGTTGQLIDARSGAPVNGAKVMDDKQTVTSDRYGFFHIDTKRRTLNVKAYGYRPARITLEKGFRSYNVTPIDVKALYLTFWGAQPDSKTLQRILKIIDETEVNAIVVDVKNEFGLTSYKTSIHQDEAIDIWYRRTIKDIESFMKLMKARDIYMIARIVVFKDELQAANHPERALRLPNGEIWRNREKMAWVDPYNRATHDYTLDIAEDAARVGFDEINFDYIRFPAKLDLLYSKPHTQENRIKAIGSFLKSAQERLRPYGTFISADTYGYVCWNRTDTNIGHTVKSLAEHTDYLAPMLYPSGFPKGTLQKEDPTQHSYYILARSIQKMHEDVEPRRIRPWLQAFKDYAHSRSHFTETQIAQQIQASDDTGTAGWMIWNPSSRYTYVNRRLFEEFLPVDNIHLLPKDSPIFNTLRETNQQTLQPDDD